MFLYLRSLDRKIYNLPIANQPTETFRCMLHKRLDYRAFTKHLQARVSIVIYIVCKFTIYKSFHSYWLDIQCCEIRYIIRRMRCEKFQVFCFYCQFFSSNLSCHVHLYLLTCVGLQIHVIYWLQLFSPFHLESFYYQHSIEFVVYALNALRKPPLTNLSFSIWKLCVYILKHCF